MNIFRKLEQYWQHPVLYWPLVILIAAATPLTFAPYYHFWLMPLLFGALIRLIELRPRFAVSTAYLFGLIAYTTQFYWIHTALHDVSGLPNLYAIPLTFLLPAFLALYPAACFWLWKKFHLPRWVKVGIVLPILWTLAEFARERLLTGFGWGALGYSQIVKESPLAGFAPLGGIHLVTLATAFVSAWLVLLIDNTGRLKQRLLPMCMIVMLCTVGFIAQQADFTKPDGSTSTVALVQGNIEQSLKWDEEQVVPTIQKYYGQISKTSADIVILPETALPVMRQDLPENILTQFAEQARTNGSALAVGIGQYTADGSGYENAVINLSDYDDVSDDLPYYAKNHLVPFGEYKPLPFLTEPLYKLMNMPLADFRRGGAAQAPLTMKGQKVAFNICYEDGFGDELIATAKKRHTACQRQQYGVVRRFQRNVPTAPAIPSPRDGAWTVYGPSHQYRCNCHYFSQRQHHRRERTQYRCRLGRACQRLCRRNALYEGRRFAVADRGIVDYCYHTVFNQEKAD